ncbi:hypothetical protein [Streptomyces sp. NPDC003877]
MPLNLCQFVLKFPLAGVQPFLGGGGGFHLAFGSSHGVLGVLCAPTLNVPRGAGTNGPFAAGQRATSAMLGT